MLPQFDFKNLKKDPRIKFYFRYPLHKTDFKEFIDKNNGSLKGYYYAKPLYGRLTKKGYVDKSDGFNGDVATIFLRSPVKEESVAVLLLGHTSPDDLITKKGTRNWEKINQTAEKAIKKYLDDIKDRDFLPVLEA